jgi:hypothetical protein
MGAAALLAALAACAPPSHDQPDVGIDVTVQPKVVGQASLTVAARDAAGAPLAIEGLEVEGNMNHAGMRPSFAELQPAGEGRWTGTLELTMGGDWFLLVTGTLPDGRRLERKVDLPGVSSK